MAYGTEAQRLIQFGQEVTAGTAVTTTAVLRVPVSQIESGKVINRPKENVGLLLTPLRSVKVYEQASLDIPEIEATFEQVQYMFEAGVKAILTGAADGAAAKVYDYLLDKATANTIKTFTVKSGDNNAVSAMPYAVCQEFTLTWAAKGGLMMSSKWFGAKRTTGASFATIALPVVEEILGPIVTITDGGTAIGTTAFDDTLVGYQLTYVTGWQPVVAAKSGTIYFTGIKNVGPTATLRMSFEHDANASTEYGKYDTQTTRLVRFLHKGSALSGSVYSNKTFQIDLAGRYTAFPPFEAQDGDNIVNVEMECGYDATADLMARFLVVNANATVT
jgi:hypothetical protein